MDLKNFIRDIPDFPSPGIMFRDITPLLSEPEALRSAVDSMAEALGDEPFDLILGPESRGFIFGVPLAYNLRKGFVPVRKAGKLPHETVKKEYALEYGTAAIEMHRDAVKPGQRVVIADDLLATGGTAKAIAALVEELGGTVTAFVFLVELAALKGKDILAGYNVRSILRY